MLKSLTEKAANLASSVKEKVEHTFSKHSGASDIVIIKHADGELRSTPWFVHCDGQIQPHDTKVQVRVHIGTRATELFLSMGKDHRCYFQPPDSDGGARCSPSESQLQMLPLVPGKNQTVFQVRQLEESTQRWSVQSEITADIFLWEATDKVVVLDFEGALLRPDAWAREAKDAIHKSKPKKEEEWDGTGSSAMHAGAGSLLSSLSHGGYRILITTSAPITRMSNRRSTMAQASRTEVDRWGEQAELPDTPVLCGTDHTAAALANKLTSKALEVAGKQGKQAAFKQSSLSLFGDLFRAADSSGDGGVGGFAGGFCRSEDVKALESAGVPASGIVVVDRSGASLRTHALADADASGQSWASFGDVPVSSLFPPLGRSGAGGGGVQSPGVLLL